VVQKAEIEVDEEGATAAAATGTVVCFTCLSGQTYRKGMPTAACVTIYRMAHGMLNKLKIL